MFVVATLIASVQIPKTDESFATFGTPNVIHFGAALLIAATLCAPWQALWGLSIPLGLYGLGGVTYVVIVLRRMRHQHTYQPVMEDWLWHLAFPFIAYIVLVIAAIALSANPTLILFFIGASTLLLLFIGIHNAWDTVTYLTVQRTELESRGQEK